MSSEWPVVRLGDLVSIRHGWPFKSEYFQIDEGQGSTLPIVVAIGNFEYSGGFRFHATQVKRYTDAFPSEFVLKAGDILLVMTCQTAGGEILGIPAKVPDDGRIYLHNQRLGLVVFRSDKISPEFAYWLFLSQNFNRHLVGTASGTKILHTAPSRIEAFQFLLPPLNEQLEISAVLSAIDDRITLLRETNATLEAIAQALFKSWFVDFDPVRAKMEGRMPDGMDEATAALFPDGFEESELGEVPRGWPAQPFSTIVNVSSGKRPENREDSPNSTFAIPLYGGAGVMGYTSSSLFDAPKILTGRVGTLGKVHIAYPPFWASDNVLVVTPKNQLFFSFAYHWLLSIDVTALNRGSTQPLLTQRDLVEQKGVVPSSQVLEVFEGVATSLNSRILANAKQTENLSTIRDALLPRLISGQLRLPEA